MDLEVNISHNFGDKKYTKKTLEKYFVFSVVIDYLVTLQQQKVNDCSLDSLVDIVMKCSHNKYHKKDWIYRWLVELKWMGVIMPVSEDRCALTDYGCDCYKSQIFHSIYSNLLDAKHSRQLSRVAIGISLVSLLCVLASYFLDKTT